MNAAAQVSRRRFLALLGVVIGAAGFTASLTGTYLAMRSFMATGTAFCASGGPFEIASECPRGTGLLAASTFGLFVFWGVFAAVTAWGKGPVLASSLFIWGMLFGLLGWNFMDFGVFNPDTNGVVWGWAVSGATFWLMALGGFIPAVIMAVRSVTSPPESQEPSWAGAVVRAAQSPTPELPSGSSAYVPSKLVFSRSKREQ